MIAFRHILCPIDFSETSTRALTCAAALARWYEARLTVLHVVPVFDENMASTFPLRGDADRVVYAPVRADVLELLRQAVARDGAGDLDPAIEADGGRPHSAIVDRAVSSQADLIVLGTHGRSGFNRLLLGSVTEKVMRTAPCPVLTVPPALQDVETQTVIFRNILCPVDFSPASLRAFDYAVDLSRQANGCVTLLHALEYMDDEEPCEHADESIRRHREHIIEDVRHRLDALASGHSQTWCAITGEVEMARAYKAILSRAAATPADLIVMGAQGRGGVGLMLYGSTAEHVVRAAPCPVLTVRGETAR